MPTFLVIGGITVGDNGSGMGRLTQKQETFCLKYFELGNASEAALLAGYSPRYAATHTTRWLNMANISQRLQELRQVAEDASVASVMERKQILTDITRGNLTDYQETGADGAWLNIGKESPHTKAIAEITSRTNEDNSVITKVKLHNPIQAISELNKMEHIYTEGATLNIDNRKVEIIVSGEEAKRLTEAILNGERTEDAQGASQEDISA